MQMSFAAARRMRQFKQAQADRQSLASKAKTAAPAAASQALALEIVKAQKRAAKRAADKAANLSKLRAK